MRFASKWFPQQQYQCFAKKQMPGRCTKFYVLVLVGVYMSDFIYRWGFDVQVSMNCLCVCIHYSTIHRPSR